MARDVVIHTWCDIDLTEKDERIDGETITWFLYDTRMEVDLCTPCQSEISVSEMGKVVEEYGRKWEDPSAPPPRRKKKSGGRKAVPPEDNPLVQAHLTEDKQYVCDVKGCAKKGEPLKSIQALRMHQYRAHDINKPQES